MIAQVGTRRRAASSYELPELAGGAQPDARITEVLEQLSSESVIHALWCNVTAADPFAGGVSGERTADLWSAWFEAAANVAISRPYDAIERLRNVATLHPDVAGSDELVEIERLALIGKCAHIEHHYLEAMSATGEALAALGRFVQRLGGAKAKREIAEMLRALFMVELPVNESLTHAWSGVRGVYLLTSLHERRQELLLRLRRTDAQHEVRRDLLAAVRRLHKKSGTALDASTRAGIEFSLGNIATDSAPAEAFDHFERVRESLGIEHYLGLKAAINSAHCLMRTGRLEEAESRYRFLESRFEERCQYRDAARVWMSEGIARWKRTRSPDVRMHAVGAIRMYEKDLPSQADPTSRFMDKRLIEEAYRLLVCTICHARDADDERRNELVAALWALNSRDLLARLEPSGEQDPWKQLLAKQARPLEAMKATLRPHPGVGVFHLLSGIDSIAGVLYGFDTGGRFRFEWFAWSREDGEALSELIGAIRGQLDADVGDDVLGVERMERIIRSTGDRLGSMLPPALTDALAAMTRIVYMPHAFGDMSEVPLGAFRVNGRFLATVVPIVRSPTINHVREMLSPAGIVRSAGREARVVLGAPDIGGESLKDSREEAESTIHRLDAFGLRASIEDDATRAKMRSWLNGDCSIVHYVGHGIANHVYESLPLGKEFFSPLDIDSLDGHGVPFVFVCACVSARVRYGAGGHSTGIASRLIERGAPAVVAFSQPIPERRAYETTARFYEEAYGHDIGTAALALAAEGERSSPAYAWLSATVYGDPRYKLSGVDNPADPHWSAALRQHVVLRTPGSRHALEKALQHTGNGLARLASRWLDETLPEPFSRPDAAGLVEIDAAALDDSHAELTDRLVVHAAVCAERLHRRSVDSIPFALPMDNQDWDSVIMDATFITDLGAALFDMPLHALGRSLLGRAICGREPTHSAAPSLRAGRRALKPWEHLSPFLAALRTDDASILRQLGERDE